MKKSDTKLEMDYQVRVSKRARRVLLKISRIGRLEVVVPAGFSHSHIPALLEKKRIWLEQHLPDASLQAGALQAAMPDTIYLAAIDEHWQVEYGSTLPGRAACKVHNGVVHLRSGLEDVETSARSLQRCLSERAKQVLPGWLGKISENNMLPFNKVSIRAQKTRWGSCSANRNISLNRNLMLLKPQLVEYLFVHELCHTVHMNHSAQYWEKVAKILPGYRELDRELRKATLQLPLWLYI